MKSLLSLMAIAFAFSITAPAFAQDSAPTTEAECKKKQDYEWDYSQGKCVEQSPGG